MFEINYENYENYGKCLKLAKGELVVRVTIEVGPRIIYFGNETRNFMWNDLNRVVNKEGEFFDTNFKKGEKWYIYGGHRLWKSPEDLASYVPDNYPVEVEVKTNGCLFSTKKQKMTGLKPSMELTFVGDGLEVKHTFTNEGAEPVTCSLWSLSVLAQGGKEIIPLNDDKTGLLPNRNFVFWEYSDFQDERLNIDNRFLTLKQDNTNTNAFKLGMFLNKGIAAYLLDGDLFVKQFLPKKGEFADFYCNFETYTSENFMEMETLSPLYTLDAGESAVHIERWNAYMDKFDGKTDADVKEFIAELSAKR